MIEAYLLQNSLLANLLVVLTVEGQMAPQQHIKDDAERPAVHSLVVGLLHQDLGRNVTKRSVGLHAGLAGAERLGKSKVDELDLCVLTLVNHEDVLGLQVSMRNAEIMHKVDGGCNLVDNGARPGFRDNKFALVKIREKVATPEQLHHDLNVVLTFEHIEKANNTGVLADLEHLDLTLDELQILERQVLLLDNLDGNLLLGALVDGLFYNTVLTFA